MQPWYDAAGAVGGIVLFVEDITADVESEEAARAARQNLADLIGTIDGIVWEADPHTFSFTFVSEQAERLLGYPVSAWLEDPGFWAAHIHPDDRDESVKLCIDFTAACRDHQFDYRMIAADGRVVWLQDRVTVHAVEGRPVLLRGVMVDITERKRAEAALRNSEERFRMLADTAPMMVWASNADGQPEFINQRWIAFFGREIHDVSPDGWYEFLHPDDREAWAAVQRHAFETRQPFEVDARSRRADGEYRWVTTHGVPRFDASGALVGYIGTSIDITERRRAEETRQRLEAQLRQSQKMEAMGTLAGGIAHDFNNLLAAIGGNLELVSMDLGATHPAQDSLGEMRARRPRARPSWCSASSPSAARTPRSEADPARAGGARGGPAAAFAHSRPASSSCTRIAPDLPDVMANASQMHQAIVNLATNAWQAMDGGPGRIDVRLDACRRRSRAHRHPRRAAARPARPPLGRRHRPRHGRQRRSSASSSRSSPPRSRARAPGWACRWSTASPAATAARSSSRASRGAARRSRCSFRSAWRRRRQPDAARVPEALRGHGERILCVDDEAPLVTLAVRFLERLGYRASGYTSAEEALAAFRRQPDAFDLVVTDYNMPGMSGMDVALTVMSERPSMLVALASGYLRPAEVEHARALGIRATIAKPYTLEDLGAAVQNLLHARDRQI